MEVSEVEEATLLANLILFDLLQWKLCASMLAKLYMQLPLLGNRYNGVLHE